MVREKKKTLIYGIVCCVAVLAAIVLIVMHGRAKPVTPAQEPVPAATPEVIVQEKLVERTITAEIIRDGLLDMGVLETQQYYFTEVISSSRVKTLLGFSLPFTESSYVISYDGVVTAGVDLSEVRISKNENTKVITVYLPEPRITAVDIDPESFQLYSEKNGLGTHFTVSDYNDSLKELERTASEKALERGLLEAADKNAQLIVKNYIGSLVDMDLYAVRFALPGEE